MIKVSIYKPITMLMVILAVVVFGFYTYSMMAVDLLPKFEIPVVTAFVTYAGASPEDVESTVLKNSEDALELIDGIDYVKSYGLENYGILICKFNMGVDVDVAASDVRDKMSQVAADFPDGVDAPIISKLDISGSAIISFVLTGPDNPIELRDRADNKIKPQLSSIPGVASVDLLAEPNVKSTSSSKTGDSRPRRGRDNDDGPFPGLQHQLSYRQS